MKFKFITPEPVPPVFQPRSVILTFESQKELDTFGALCNFEPMRNVLTLPHCSDMEKLGANVDGTSEIVELLYSCVA
jgi:hypothetical protein